jgi:hypothetical protein
LRLLAEKGKVSMVIIKTEPEEMPVETVLNQIFFSGSIIKAQGFIDNLANFLYFLVRRVGNFRFEHKTPPCTKWIS